MNATCYEFIRVSSLKYIPVYFFYTPINFGSFPVEKIFLTPSPTLDKTFISHIVN